MPNYRSLAGGYFSYPTDPAKPPVSIRSNNPGAVNGASWERSMPGYVTEIKFDGKNNTTIFETPEQGVAVWYELMKRYESSGADTVGSIIKRYGGGQDYSEYAKFVSAKTGFPVTKKIDLSDDKVLLPFAKAMFQYEAGRVPPWSDTQIIYGFDLVRGFNLNRDDPSPPVVPDDHSDHSFWISLLSFPFGWFLRKPAAPSNPPPQKVATVTNKDIIDLATSYIGKFTDGPDVVTLANFVADKFPELKDYCRQANNSMPWCGDFVGYVLAHFGIRPPMPDANGVGYFYVDSWKKFGTAIPVGQEQPGDICLFVYPGRLHHITFVAGDGFYVGGNQSDAVTKTRFGLKPSYIRRAV